MAASLICLSLIPMYLIMACVADYTGVSQMIVQKFVTALEQFSCGMHPVNAAATLQDPPQFLGFTRLGQICETQDGRQLQIVDSSKVKGEFNFFLQDPDIIKCTSAKAAHLLGIGSDKVSSDSVRSVGPHLDEIRKELGELKATSHFVTFSRRIASLMTRMSALAWEIGQSDTDVDTVDFETFSHMHRLGFPHEVNAKVIFADARWPNTLAVAFWNTVDNWITVSFKGTDPLDLQQNVLNMFCETRVLKCGGVCSSTVWKALCLEHTGTIPFFSISKRIEHLRKTHWPAQKTAPTLFITGQGFGGSIAELFLYLKLGKTIDCPMAAYTFGALGVGDFKYRADFQQRRGRQSFKSALFSLQNSLDVLTYLPSGLRSAGKVVKLSCSATKRRSSTPVFIVDLGICLKDVKKWFISCNVWEKMRSAVYGDEQASSYLIYWFWANAPKPFSSHSAIAYFHNLTHGSVEL